MVCTKILHVSVCRERSTDTLTPEYQIKPFGRWRIVTYLLQQEEWCIFVHFQSWMKKNNIDHNKDHIGIKLRTFCSGLFPPRFDQTIAKALSDPNTSYNFTELMCWGNREATLTWHAHHGVVTQTYPFASRALKQNMCCPAAKGDGIHVTFRL